ncbi:AraC family transcriptional regulator [Streptomyces sp. H10-C2]|uniref:helix-turn-helix domain-containing protein n=1 Tax=unclassified Streptomyces TaxID=2593676 RepID=UPI0024B9362E|nr:MULTISPECIES: AraC family transcriptional regulator [unclassified Streptomyces]MDJ0344596.1 AraC family transcriptional regulator [Streptomyces sp. PH10-H1]MDJ0370995.1 AraC family transcriptional regulator [Streptomyces sp. H10-C2]
MTTPGMGRGVLRPAVAATKFELLREEPGAAAAPYVEFYWMVRWDLRGQPPHEQKVLSHPNVHLVFEAPATAVYGVQRGVFTRVLRDRGQVLGIKFRPGGFRPLLGSPVADLADRAVPATELFGPAVTEAERTILGASDVSAMVATAETFLLSLLPDPDAAPDPVTAEVAAMVDRITASPALFRVDQVADELGVSVRRLQRLFAEHVGASPKWVLRRARLHEAAARADQGVGIDWAALAADLGYSDQAHLTRDFTATVGAPPARYAGA